MAEKRKISIRKILQVLLTVVVSTCCVIAMVSASKIESGKNLVSVAVHIKNDKKYHFIEQEQIMDLAINNRHVDIMHTPLSQLDIQGIEQVIKSDPWVAEAQAFVDMNRVLHMYVTQRVPVARIFEQDGKSYYMDATLHTMPLSEHNIYYTTVVTNVPDLTYDTAMKEQIYAMASAVEADTFWNAQISQIIVDSARTFELLPVIGNQRIVFGPATDIREKLDNLFVFYKNVLNKIGWDKYETLDLRFKGQVVASPSLPYKGVTDKAVDKMNWINSIIITEAQRDSRDSLRAADLKGLLGGTSGIGGRQVSAAPQAVAKTTAGNPAVAKAAVAAGVIGAGVLVARQLKKPGAAAADKKAAGATAKTAAAAHPAGKQLVPGRQAPAAKATVKAATSPTGKGNVLARQAPATKPGLKPPSAPFGKGTVVAKPGTATKPADKHKQVAKPADNKKSADKKKQAGKKKDTDKKKAAAKGKAKPVVKKNVKPVAAKKEDKTSKGKNTKQPTPKYAYPENKEHK